MCDILGLGNNRADDGGRERSVRRYLTGQCGEGVEDGFAEEVEVVLVGFVLFFSLAGLCSPCARYHVVLAFGWFVGG